MSRPNPFTRFVQSPSALGRAPQPAAAAPAQVLPIPPVAAARSVGEPPALTPSSPAAPPPAVLRFQANTAGRDFVVSDIHGAYGPMLNALRAVGFDTAVDRLFVVGDTTDRGPESLRALAFLKQPWVKALRGNHEDFWLSMYEKGPPDPAVVEALGDRMNLGVDWWLAAPPDKRDALVAEFRKMPLAMEIETERGTVGLVHADVPRGMDWPTFVEKLQSGDEHTIETAIWGRCRLKHGDASGVRGIGRLFVGHSIQEKGPTRLGNVYAIDTGAVVGLLTGDREEGRLTLANITMKTESLSKPERALLDELIDLYDDPPDDPSTPFGNYAAPRPA
jgi:serine/threonine protein phosphatase 1